MEVCELHLVGGRVALLDREDFDKACWFTWKCFAGGNTFYAIASQGNNFIKLHRWVLNAPSDMVVDHIDGNGLNNVRSNLRLATRQQNSRNKFKIKKKSKMQSVYIGVEPRTGKKYRTLKWRACIYVDRKRIRLGTFATEEEAARARDAAAQSMYGEFSKLNFSD